MKLIGSCHCLVFALLPSILSLLSVCVWLFSSFFLVVSGLVLFFVRVGEMLHLALHFLIPRYCVFFAGDNSLWQSFWVVLRDGQVHILQEQLVCMHV